MSSPYSITPSGGTGSGFMDREIPETTKNIGGGEVSTVVNGFTHDLYPLPSRITATLFACKSAVQIGNLCSDATEDRLGDQCEL